MFPSRKYLYRHQRSILGPFSNRRTRKASTSNKRECKRKVITSKLQNTRDLDQVKHKQIHKEHFFHRPYRIFGHFSFHIRDTIAEFIAKATYNILIFIDKYTQNSDIAKEFIKYVDYFQLYQLILTKI